MEFSAEISKAGKSFLIVDHSSFQTYLLNERLSSHAQHEDTVARWLARVFHADVVVVGETPRSPLVS